MIRFALCGFVTVCGAVLLALAGGAGVAAPVPRDAGKNDPTPDFKAIFDVVAKAVQDEKWPTEADEKQLKDAPRVVFEGALKAAGQKQRRLPVSFEKLTRADVVKEYKRPSVRNALVIAGNVRVTDAQDSVIFASGDVKLGGALNCVIVARNVCANGVDNSVIVAGEFIGLTASERTKDGDRSVLVAGQWISATELDGTICHVLRPGNRPSPEDRPRIGAVFRAIQTNVAKDVIYLNARADTSGSAPDQQTYLPLKDPIAK
jgi:hypothetical protein